MAVAFDVPRATGKGNNPLPACACAHMRKSAASLARTRARSAPSSFARHTATQPESIDAGARNGCVRVAGSSPTRHQMSFSN